MSSQWLLSIFFSAVGKALLDRPADRRLAHLNPANGKEKLVPLPVSRPWTSLDVLLKQAHSALIQLRRRAWCLLGSKRATLVKPLKVASDRRTVDSEPASGLADGDAPSSHGLYYLGAQV
jgi:hypothetical protein